MTIFLMMMNTLRIYRIVEICTPVIYGSGKIAAYHRKALDLPPVTFNIIDSAENITDDKINLINCIDEDIKVELGTSTTMAGVASLKSLQRAVDDFANGEYDVLVTAPINKNNIQSEEFHFPGHTEFLEKECGNGKKSLMILMQDGLRVALVTGHLPITELSAHITKENVLSKSKILNQVQIGRAHV